MICRRFCSAVSLSLVCALAARGQEASPSPAMQYSPLLESVVSGKPGSAVLSLGLKDAVSKALQNNLASVLGTEAERTAAAERLSQLAELFPRLEARASSEQRQVNLAGFGFSGFPGVHQVIGPFALVDARASFSQSVLDLEQLHKLHEATDKERAAALSSMNVRELVVLTAVDLYFQVVSAESRVDVAKAQLARAKALHERAINLKSAGVVPGIDVLRAEVEVRTVEQRLIAARNTVQKDKLSLARAIGLPLNQEFLVVDRLPDGETAVVPTEALLDRAYKNRADARAVEARLRAAEEAVKAAQAKGAPKVQAKGDYGAIGRTPGNSHGTYSLSLEVRVPIFDRTIETKALEKEVEVRRRQAERDSLHNHIEFEVRAALLDLESATQQLQVFRQSVLLAQQQLDQAQDRFIAGVANNLEVVQAQESSALADEGVIQGLYGFNIARVLLAKAIGETERSVQEFLAGSLSK